MSLPNWHDPLYLAAGTARQQAAYQALCSLRMWDLLAAYTPVLAGTIPLNIDIDSSDLDIICEVHDPGAFARDVRRHFDTQPGFSLRQRQIDSLPTVIANFTAEGFPVEIFGQPRPVQQQNAYAHLTVEARLLRLGGEDARRAIQDLKRAGLKTEPAFACYFGLPGDPYQALLALAALDDAQLIARVRPSA